MTALTPAEVKLHLRVDSDAEDSLIQQYMAAAHDQVEQFLGREVPWDVTSALPGGVYPAAVRQGELQIIGDLYRNRETNSEPGTALYALLFPYRVGLGV